MRPDISGGHADPGSADLADDRQDRRCPGGVDDAVPGDTRRAVGTAGDTAALCQGAAPVPA